MPADVDYPRRVRGGVICLVVFIVLGMSVILSSAVELGRHVPPGVSDSASLDRIATAKKRFACLRELLSPDGVAGYVTDADKLSDTRHIAIQYALVPTIVLKGTDARVIIGEFGDPGNAREFMTREDLVLVHDCGNGVYLFERKPE